MTTSGDEISGVEFQYKVGSKEENSVGVQLEGKVEFHDYNTFFQDLLTIYKFYHDAASLFDRRRAKEFENSFISTCVRLGVDINEIHKAWREYRMEVCSKLGNRMSNPSEKVAEVLL